MKSLSLTLCVIATVVLLWTPQAVSDEPNTAQTPAADHMRGKEPGDVRDDNGLKMKLVWCPPGFFKMQNVEVIVVPAAGPLDEPASNDDVVVDAEPKDKPEPRRTEKIIPVKVILTKGYWLGRYEVTQSEWNEVMRTKPWEDDKDGKDGDDFPATFVTWERAMDFCRKLTNQERQAGRLSDDWEYTLPTEAQWEWACRARTATKYNFGDDQSILGDYAWFQDNAWDAREKFAHRVGQKKANLWGLYDMHGNAWEWCGDVYQEILEGGRDPEVKSEGRFRVFRGGGFGAKAEACRSGDRFRILPGHRGRDFGFRVALSSVVTAPEDKADSTNNK